MAIARHLGRRARSLGPLLGLETGAARTALGALSQAGPGGYLARNPVLNTTSFSNAVDPALAHPHSHAGLPPLGPSYDLPLPPRPHPQIQAPSSSLVRSLPHSRVQASSPSLTSMLTKARVQTACKSTVPLRSTGSEVEPPEMPPFDHVPAKYTGPKADEVLALRKAHLNPAIFHYYKTPVNIVEGKMQYLYDESGRRYLDAFAGIVTVSVGHCHPTFVEAVVDQSRLLQHITNIYLNHQVAEYAKELADKMPGNLKNVYFVNSGSEANDMAMMMARLHTGNYDIVALRNCYHGMSPATMGVTALNTWKYNVPQGFGIHHAMNPDPYRGLFGADGPRYANDVAEIIQYSTSGSVAAFMAETIQGVGGAVPLAPGYLPAVYDIVKAAGGVCIADEVQTGFGRTGSHYWGFETQGVMPDIVTMAKGIGNGLPLAAVVTTPEIAATVAQRLHFNTYGGNPISAAGGRAVLRIVDEEKRQEHCAAVGTHLLERLRALQQKHDVIGDVRGQGLMLGVELVLDRASKAPAKAETAQAFEKMKDLGVLVGKGGYHGNVFRIKPPMCFSMEDADFLVECLDIALSEL